jgi:hypothetical protein
MWAATDVWTWQGSHGNPLAIEGVVAPMVAEIVARDGVHTIAADNVYAPELRRGMGGDISLKVQGGELKDIYGPMRRGAHEDWLYVEPVGLVWTGDEWREDERTGERVAAGLAAVMSEVRDGKLVVWLPEHGNSHHDEFVAVARALWFAGAGRTSGGTAERFGADAYRAQTRGAYSYPTPGY